MFRRKNNPAIFDAPEKAYGEGIRWSLAGSAASAFFQLFQMVVFARFASPADMGDYALAAAMIGFLAPIAEAGVSQSVVYARETSPEQMAALVWINFALGFLIFLGIYAAGNAIATWYERPALAALLTLMGISLLITPLGALNAGLLTRAMRFDDVAKVEISSWIISSATVSVLAWNGQGPMAMGAGFLARNLVTTAGLTAVSGRLFSLSGFRPGHLRTVGLHLRFGLLDLSARWADFMANYLDKFVVGKWLGPAALGYYNLAFTFLMLPTARLGYVVARVAFPLFAHLRDDAAQIQRHFQKAGRDVIIVLFPVYAGISLFSREIIDMVFGHAWLPAAPLLIAFGLAGLVRSCCVAIPQLVRGVGKPQLLLVWMLAWTLALNVFLIAFLALDASAESAAWSRVAAKFSVEILMLRWLAGRCGVRFDPSLRFAAKTLLWFFPVAAVTWLSGQIPGAHWPVFALKTSVFLTGLWWFAFKSPLQKEALEVMRLFRFERKP